MHRGLLVREEREIEDIWRWFYDQQTALLDYRTKVINAVQDETLGLHWNFSNFTGTLDELDDYFDASNTNLEHLVCLDLVTAAEAMIRLDSLNRAKGKRRIFLSDKFGELYKKKERVSLEHDLIEIWKDTTVRHKKCFSDFIGLLNYRDWLAHGRYWVPKIGEKYTPEKTLEIITKVRDTLQAN